MDRMDVDSLSVSRLNIPVFYLGTEDLYSARAAKPLFQAIKKCFPESPIFCCFRMDFNRETVKNWIGDEAENVGFVPRVPGKIFGTPDIVLEIPYTQLMKPHVLCKASWHVKGRCDITINPELVKFDVECAVSEAEKTALKKELGIGKQFVFVAGSVESSKGGMAACSAVHRILAEETGVDVVSVVAPRTSDFFKEKTDLFRNARLRSKTYEKPIEGSGVVLLDSFGELPKIYAIADAAFVDGEHNILEPAAHGVPVLYWRENDMFPFSRDGLFHAKGGFPIESYSDLPELLKKLAQNPDLRKQMGANARNFKEAHSGYCMKLMEQVKRIVAEQNKGQRRLETV